MSHQRRCKVSVCCENYFKKNGENESSIRCRRGLFLHTYYSGNYTAVEVTCQNRKLHDLLANWTYL